MANDQSTKLKNGGPKGLGDPEDMSLRHVEIDVLIPQKMRDIARTEKCVPEVAAFTECGKSYGLSMVYFCQKQNQIMKDCITRWYQDEAFKERCKKEYLEERSEYRRTGITKKKHKTLREIRKELELQNEIRESQNLL